MELDDEIQKLDELLAAEKQAHQNDPAYLDMLCSDSSEFETDDEESDNASVQDNSTEHMVEAPLPLDNQLSAPISATDISQIVPYLTFEEYNIIINCEDPRLKELLILNRTKKIQLRTTVRKFSNMLMQCNNQIRFEQEIKDTSSSKTKKHNKGPAIGYPYFRHKNIGPYAYNEDKKRMLRSNDINTAILPKRIFWNINQQINLKSAIMWNYFSNRLEDYRKQLEELEANVEDETSTEILKIRSDLEAWKSKGTSTHMVPPPLWNDTFIDWDDIVINTLSDPEMSKASRAFWNLYLHPDINKSMFTEEDNATLKVFVENYGGQNWDAIAGDLNNGRSPYLLCVHYMSNLCDIYYQHPFSREEDDLLRMAIKNVRTGHIISWQKVAAQFSDRSREQLYNRYLQIRRHLDYKAGKFSDAEDIMLLCLIRKYGENFNKISANMLHRRKAQLIERYYGYLKSKDMLYGSYTIEEDKIIMDHVKKHNGSKNWSSLSTILKRNACHLRHRYGVLNRYFSKNPNCTLADVSRRKQRRGLTEKHARKHKLAEQYNESNIFPALETDRKVRAGIGGRPQRSYVDNQLINFFRVTAHIPKARSIKTIYDDQLKNCASSINTVLNTLGVKLDIPQTLDTSSGRLDKIDLELLNILRNQPKTTPTIIVDIPPNISTIQGLRALLLWHKINKEVNSKPTTTAEANALHLKGFRERFGSLFRWPALMSITQPEQHLIDGEEPDVAAMAVDRRQVRGTSEKKRCGRPRKNLNKIEIMNQARKKAMGSFTVKTEDKVNVDSNMETVTIEVPPICFNKVIVTKQEVTTDSKKPKIIDLYDDSVTGTNKKIVSTQKTVSSNKKIGVKKNISMYSNKTNISPEKVLTTGPDVTAMSYKSVQPQPAASTSAVKPVTYLKPLDKATAAKLKWQLQNKMMVVKKGQNNMIIRMVPGQTNKTKTSTIDIDLPLATPDNTTITPSFDAENLDMSKTSHLPLTTNKKTSHADSSEDVDDPSFRNSGHNTTIPTKSVVEDKTNAPLNYGNFANMQLDWATIQKLKKEHRLDLPKGPNTKLSKSITIRTPSAQTRKIEYVNVNTPTDISKDLKKEKITYMATSIKRKLTKNNVEPKGTQVKKIKMEDIEISPSPET